MRAMRRKDRQVTDFETIRQIIDSCEVIRIGLSDPEDPMFPYIVPLNFGYTVDEQKQVRFFIHGARAGRKFELLQKQQCCSFQMECNTFLELVPQGKDVTMRYQCVMGKADVTLLEDDDALRALEIVMSRREDTRNFDWNRNAVPRTAVWELKVTELTGKVNKPKSGPD